MINLDLNTPQNKAVTHKNGTLVIVAGAGSGKTRVITTRMMHLIVNEKIAPESIVALTFTNKAAQEMKNRLSAHLKDEVSSLPFVGTFHSYCLYLLRKNHAPFPNFSILDDDDSKTLIKNILKKHGLEKKITPARARSYISKMKNSLSSLDENYYDKKLLDEVAANYEEEKKTIRSLDFDDLLLEGLNLFKNNHEFCSLFQKTIRHILVDEYQDTNAAQHQLLKAMALSSKKLALDSLCIVGDEDQAIYSWRGAVVENMLNFKKDFGTITTIKIEQNYRSVQPILKAANTVIANNTQRNEKKLWSEKKARNRILKLTAHSEYHESDMIVEALRANRNTYPQQTLGILYRTHQQSRVLEEALIKAHIPYRIIGGINFYQRKEIKDLLAYLRLIVNPYDRISFFRILNCPARGLGDQCETLISSFWSENILFDFKQVIESLLASTTEKLPLKKRESLRFITNIYTTLSKKNKPSIAIKYILEKTNYLSYIRKSYEKQEAEERIAIVSEFVTAADYFENNQSQRLSESTGTTTEDFLLNVALMQDHLNNNNDKQPSVLMMTLHAAKGLEFDTVILPGLEEELFPSYNSINQKKQLEEERRLFYVGMTRAREYLILTSAKRRTIFGTTTYQKPSRFSQEVPSSLSQETDATRMSLYDTRQLFRQWFGGGTPSQSITFFGAPASTKKPNLAKPCPTWKKNHPVMHKTFGVGIVKKIEKKDKNSYYLTVHFKSGSKKLLSSFLSPL